MEQNIQMYKAKLIDGKLMLISTDIQVGDKVYWEKQRYFSGNGYENYIGKFYTLERPIGMGLGMIVLKDFYPKKTFEECKESIISMLKRHNRERTEEQIDENARKNQETSGDLHLKVGYNISENDVIKVIGEISPDATWVKEGDEFDESDIDHGGWVDEDLKTILIKIKGPCGHFH